VPVVAAIDAGNRSALWVLVVGWSAAALIVGGIMWVVRRK